MKKIRTQNGWTNSEPVEVDGYTFEKAQVLYCDCGCVYGVLGVNEGKTAMRLLVITASEGHDGDHEPVSAGEVIEVAVTGREE
jgi:hypothetical protein